jgi:hypothetical protein
VIGAGPIFATTGGPIVATTEPGSVTGRIPTGIIGAAAAYVGVGACAVITNVGGAAAFGIVGIVGWKTLMIGVFADTAGCGEMAPMAPTLCARNIGYACFRRKSR